ncbi:MAG: hypothetical protein EOQ55_08895 [Mesorhizobium sp.]|uniref:hypothetical protein n=1 Tax=Mesorhizobium sp. TaxID=1871066 RepID=UPI000FE379FC|nr:hypothetical protein [Mesorhizobium sp.]RWG21123.1 MAG: hypothetical protein EOQ55_08895 [Mesorhizobium sp.]RWK34196.1 MAG: hypothetical protein EOR40_18510 [Mesorhizobium sp.]RWK87289.1 MAG: hypothetical protein EOR52_18280 [Mesorhizobium sp.]
MNFGYTRRVDKGIDEKNDRESLPFEVKLRRREFPMLSIDGSSRHLDAAQSAECEPIAHNGQRTPNKAPHLVQRKDLQVKAEQNRTDERAKLARAKSELCAHIQDLPLESLIRSGSAADGVEDSAVPWSSQVRGGETVAHSPGIAVLPGRNSGRKTSSHFLELLSGQM